jgi:hypothetical protein
VLRIEGQSPAQAVPFLFFSVDDLAHPKPGFHILGICSQDVGDCPAGCVALPGMDGANRLIECRLARQRPVTAEFARCGWSIYLILVLRSVILHFEDPRTAMD